MKLKPIKNYQDYQKFQNYLESVLGKEIDNEESDKIEIISVLLEEYERKINPNDKEFIIEPIIDYVFDLVKGSSKYENPGMLERGLKLSEECGELSAEILKLSGYKRSEESIEKINENILLEATDCMIMIFDIMIEMGFSKQEISDMSEKQINKWLSNIKIK